MWTSWPSRTFYTADGKGGGTWGTIKSPTYTSMLQLLVNIIMNGSFASSCDARFYHITGGLLEGLIQFNVTTKVWSSEPTTAALGGQSMRGKDRHLRAWIRGP